MGAAKRRGTREERVNQAVVEAQKQRVLREEERRRRQKEDDDRLDKEEAEAKANGTYRPKSNQLRSKYMGAFSILALMTSLNMPRRWK